MLNKIGFYYLVHWHLNKWIEWNWNCFEHCNEILKKEWSFGYILQTAMTLTTLRRAPVAVICLSLNWRRMNSIWHILLLFSTYVRKCCIKWQCKYYEFITNSFLVIPAVYDLMGQPSYVVMPVNCVWLFKAQWNLFPLSVVVLLICAKYVLYR